MFALLRSSFATIATMGRDQGGLRRRMKHGKDLLPHKESEESKSPHSKGSMAVSTKSVGISTMVITTLLMVAYFRYQQYWREIVITPLDTPSIIAANATSPAVNPDRFWGTYR